MAQLSADQPLPADALLIARAEQPPRLVHRQLRACLAQGARAVAIALSSADIASEAASEWAGLGVLVLDGPATPLTLLAAGEAPPPARDARPLQPAAGRLAGVRVLLAEDDAMNRLVLSDMLANEAVSLVCTENGADALAQIGQRGADAFDLVLCDIEMPVMDGFSAARRIRELAPDLPIIGLSAHTLDTIQERGRGSGMTAYLSKPYRMADLLSMVEKHARFQRP